MSYKNGGDTYDDEHLSRYLAGLLDDEASERLDELSIADDQFASRLRAVEDDLVDGYVRDELSAEKRDRFQSRYLSTAAGRDKVRFAEALLTHQTRQSPSVATLADRGIATGSKLRAWVAFWAMAAVAVLVAAAGYLVAGKTRLQTLTPAEPPRASVEPLPVPQAESPLAPVTEPARPDTPVLAFVLLPPTRGVSEPPSLPIPPDTTKLEVRLVLEADDFGRYEVALKDPGRDRILWRSARLKSISSQEGRLLAITLDTTSLKPQRYVLELTGYRATDEAELISSYPFRVVLK